MCACIRLYFNFNLQTVIEYKQNGQEWCVHRRIYALNQSSVNILETNATDSDRVLCDEKPTNNNIV